MNKIHIQKMVHTNKNQRKKNQKNFTGKETLPQKGMTLVRVNQAVNVKRPSRPSSGWTRVTAWRTWRTGAQTSLWTVCLNVFLGAKSKNVTMRFTVCLGGGGGRFTQRFLVCRPSTWRLTCLSSVIPFWCIQSWTTFPHWDRSRRTSVRLLKIH